MKDLLTYIFSVLIKNEQARVEETDLNSYRWYEVITTCEEKEKCLQKSDTIEGIVKTFGQYMDKFRFDEINIVIMEDRVSPKEVFRFFSDSLIYSLIHDYFKHQGKLEEMRFTGQITFDNDGTPKFTKEFYYYGELAEIFIDEIAFTYFRNLTCYIPDLGEEDVKEDGCTFNDFLEVTEKNGKMARHLFFEVTWEYPSTLYDQWGSTGALDELENFYKQDVYSFADAGDFVLCCNCNSAMLLPTGADKCPVCGREGCLSWKDDSQREMTHSKLEELGKYKIIPKNEPAFQEYLSKEVLENEFFPQ